MGRTLLRLVVMLLLAVVAAAFLRVWRDAPELRVATPGFSTSTAAPEASPFREPTAGIPRGNLLPAPSGLDPSEAVRRHREGVRLLARGEYGDALLPLSDAYAAFPDVPEVCFPLARVYHLLHLTREAVALLPCLRAGHDIPAAALDALVSQLEKSAEFEMEFDVAVSDHFIASHARGGAAARRIGEVLDLLERSRESVGGSLGFETMRQVPVVVYEGVDFGRATGSAEWASGRYDGKIRVAVELLETRPRGFAQAIEHEYVHAVLHEFTGSRVPAWMHEGLANFVTEAHSAPGPLREGLRALHTLPNVRALSRSFTQLPVETARLAYQQSYWMVRSLAEEHGIGAITDLVLDLEAHPRREFEEAFRDRFGDWSEVFLDRWYDHFLGGS